MNKVFGVGLNKTGTSTLGLALRTLGYSHTSYSKPLLEELVKGNHEALFEVAREHDAFEDWPWPLAYKELDAEFPGSKFVLTVRKSPEAWLKSLKKHSLNMDLRTSCRKLAYGYYYPHGHEAEHIAFYEKHNAEVKDYFKDRPDDLLVVSWEDGAGWKELCTFLGKPVPKEDFPHVPSTQASDVSQGRRTINKVVSKVLSKTSL